MAHKVPGEQGPSEIPDLTADTTPGTSDLTPESPDTLQETEVLEPYHLRFGKILGWTPETKIVCNSPKIHLRVILQRGAGMATQRADHTGQEGA